MADEPAWSDLAEHGPGRQVGQEANRRRRVEGAGADRSWRVGAEGEHVVAEALAELVRPSRWEKLRGRPARWWVLHSIPVGTGSTDIDHVLCGPPGVFTINTKHHRHRHATRRVVIEGDRVLVGQRETAYVAKAVAEAQLARRLLTAALGERNIPGLTVRPILAIVGARVIGTGRPGGVTVATPANLMDLRVLPERLSHEDVAALYEVARRSTTWTQ